MPRWLARLITGWCEWHDRPWPGAIARLEAVSGVNPNAEAELFARVVTELREGRDSVDSLADPDLIDCGNHRCRKRRGLVMRSP